MRADLLSVAEYRTLSSYAVLGDQDAVARDLGLSVQTVKNELTGAYKKLGVRTPIAAFRAIGWLRLPHEDRLPRDERDPLLLGPNEAAVAMRAASSAIDLAIKRTSD